jgi:hypothetical protein
VCTSMCRAMSGEQMIRRFACVITAMASFSLHEPLAKHPSARTSEGMTRIIPSQTWNNARLPPKIRIYESPRWAAIRLGGFP